MTDFELRGVKVFSATTAANRNLVGDRVTQWLESRAGMSSDIVYKFIVKQSSDVEFHCFTIVVLWGVNKLR